MNPFTAIPAHVRRWLYLTWGTAGLAVGSVTAYIAATPADESLPWLGGVAAALVVVGTGLGFTAAANTVESTAVKDDESPTGEVAGEASTLPTGTPVETIPGTVMADPLDAPSQDYDGFGAPTGHSDRV